MLHRSRRRSCEAADEAPGGAESRDSERCESRHLKKSRLRHSAGYPHFISFSGSKRRSKPWGAGYRVAEQHSSRAARLASTQDEISALDVKPGLQVRDGDVMGMSENVYPRVIEWSL